VRSPGDLAWWIQHNTVWSDLFRYDEGRKPASRVLQYKLRRFLYDDIVEMTKFPNYKGAGILGFCLHVFGFTVEKKEFYRDRLPLQIAALRRRTADAPTHNAAGRSDPRSGSGPARLRRAAVGVAPARFRFFARASGGKERRPFSRDAHANLLLRRPLCSARETRLGSA
jgi:hypothetical protein